MRLDRLHQLPPSTAPIYRRAGEKIISKIYGPKAKFVKTVSGRYSKQPVFALKYEGRKR